MAGPFSIECFCPGTATEIAKGKNQYTNQLKLLYRSQLYMAHGKDCMLGIRRNNVSKIMKRLSISQMSIRKLIRSLAHPS